MADLNKEALDIWGSLKPMIDEEIASRTQGMVQRRKAKVTTAPSLVTNTIGVTEAFGQEIFLPFVTNIASAKVGDFVWIEWMYGASNAFVSCFAAVDDKNLTVAGTVDVVQRRCYATLSSTGWKRVMQVEWSADVESTGLDGLMTDFYIVRRGQTGYAEDHKITLVSHRVDSFAFVDETSYSGYQVIDKIRCTKVGKYNYVDIHYTGTSDDVSVHFYPYASSLARVQGITSMNLANVADAPSGEAVVTTYSFNANGTGDVTVNGVLDVVNRRCYRGSDFVSGAGWKRAMDINFNSLNDAKFASGAQIDICIGSTYFDTDNMLRKITLNGIFENVTFDYEHSKSNNLNLIDKIRYTRDSYNHGHIDIHYNYSSRSYLWVTFDVHTFVDYQGMYVASDLIAVADSPSGETVVTEYTFAKNVQPTYLKRYVDSTAANYTIGSGGYVMVNYPSGLTGNKVVSIGIETWTSNSGPFLICPYGSTNTYWFIIGSSGTTINGIKFVYWYID